MEEGPEGEFCEQEPRPDDKIDGPLSNAAHQLTFAIRRAVNGSSELSILYIEFFGSSHQGSSFLRFEDVEFIGNRSFSLRIIKVVRF